MVCVWYYNMAIFMAALQLIRCPERKMNCKPTLFSIPVLLIALNETATLAFLSCVVSERDSILGLHIILSVLKKKNHIMISSRGYAGNSRKACHNHLKKKM